MADNLQQKINKTGKHCESQGELSRRIEQNGGICGDSREADALLEKLQSDSSKTKEQITEIFKDRIRYFKLVDNAKELNLSGTLGDILSKLKAYLNLSFMLN